MMELTGWEAIALLFYMPLTWLPLYWAFIRVSRFLLVRKLSANLPEKASDSVSLAGASMWMGQE